MHLFPTTPQSMGPEVRGFLSEVTSYSVFGSGVQESGFAGLGFRGVGYIYICIYIYTIYIYSYI